jgi:hypothetical protein
VCRGRNGRVRKVATRVGAWLAALSLVACDMGLTGPGTVEGRVIEATSPGVVGLGAAVLDVTWRGVLGFSGRGATQVYWAPVAGSPDRYRVVLVAPSGQDLLFSVQIEALHSERPTLVVVEAADSANEPVPASAVSVRMGG